MERKLQTFIENVASLAALRNNDEFNPNVFLMQKPLTQIEFCIAASKLEPSYMGIPVNTTWVVLEPSSQYYMKALKLRDVEDVENATDIPQPQPDLWWVMINTYDEIWSDPQFYLGNRGEQGPQGPQGPAGPQGEAGPAPDMQSILCGVKQQLSSLNGTLEILGPDSVQKGDNQQYTLRYTRPADPCTIGSQPIVENVRAPIYFQGSRNGFMDGNNKLWVEDTLSGTENAKLVAYFPAFGEYAIAEKDVSLMAAVVTGIQISGPNSVYGSRSIQLVCTAQFSDGSSSVVSAGAAWSVDNTAQATMSGRTLTAALGATTGTVTVTASYTADGQTFTDTQVININQLLVNSLTVNGPSAVTENTTANYTATANYNDGLTGSVVPVWSLSAGAPAGISSGGVLSANEVSADTPVTVTATYTLNGQETIGNKVVNVTNVVIAPAPKFGVGAAAPTDMQALYDALAFQGNPGVRTTTFSLDVLGASTYQWFIYPKSFGMAQFQDALTMFIGGMGGAGASGPGVGPDSAAAGEDRPIEVSLLIGGVQTVCYAYRSEQPNLGRSETNPDTNFSINKWNVL